jgi:hypothetical protein
MPLYQTAADPNGLGAVVGDKCMPAKKGFDIIKKKSIQEDNEKRLS